MKYNFGEKKNGEFRPTDGELPNLQGGKVDLEDGLHGKNQVSPALKLGVSMQLEKLIDAPGKGKSSQEFGPEQLFVEMIKQNLLPPEKEFKFLSGQDENVSFLKSGSRPLVSERLERDDLRSVLV